MSAPRMRRSVGIETCENNFYASPGNKPPPLRPGWGQLVPTNPAGTAESVSCSDCTTGSPIGDRTSRPIKAPWERHVYSPNPASFVQAPAGRHVALRMFAIQKFSTSAGARLCLRGQSQQREI